MIASLGDTGSGIPCSFIYIPHQGSGVRQYASPHGRPFESVIFCENFKTIRLYFYVSNFP